MKYFKKFILLGIFALFWVCFCNTTYAIWKNFVDSNTQTISAWNSYTTNYTWIYCYMSNNSTCNRYVKPYDPITNEEITWITYSAYAIYCLNENAILTNTHSSNSCTIRFYTQFNNISTIFSWYCPSCPSCPDQYTSLECQTEYNLIPIEDVTKNYCEVNFDLIDPLDCPSSPSWSGDVSWSALYIDNIQYSGAPNIYININDLLEYSMTYVSWSAVVDVVWYSYDTWYMSDILTIQEYHPTWEDFTVSFVSFLTYALPYVVVILFVVFVRKLIRKIFKF